MAQCGTCVSRLYKTVIEEVVLGVKESFLDEGIDDQILADLRQTWESKLTATRAAEHSEMTQQHQQASSAGGGGSASSSQQNQQNPPAQQPPAGPSLALVPVQITVPSQQAGGVSKTITIHVPSTALSSGVAGPQLQSILSSPAAAQTFALEATQAAEIIQRQLNAALVQNGVVLPPQLLQYGSVGNKQVDGPVDEPLKCCISCNEPLGVSKRPTPKSWSQILECENEEITVKVPTDSIDNIFEKKLKTAQIDGAHGLGDSSDEISDDDDDDDDEDDKDDLKKLKDEEDEEDADDDAWNDDPLNSEDDVSDDDGGDIFETDNVVVCQYDKITRVRNKWKFHLKDGIMNLKGKDYVFTKATGEGEW